MQLHMWDLQLLDLCVYWFVLALVIGHAEMDESFPKGIKACSMSNSGLSPLGGT